LRAAALIALAIGAVGCEYLMLRVGRRNPSAVLMAMFAAWVLAPFAALGWCQVASAWWSKALRNLLHATSLLVAIGSLLVYGYVALPLGSLLLIAVLVVAAGKRKEPNQPPEPIRTSAPR